MVPGRRLNYVLATTIVLALGACEPPRVYRMPVPPSSNTILGPRVPQTPAPIPPSPPAEVARKPLPQETKIREQDLKSRAPSANSPVRETKEPTRQSSINENRATPESTVAPAPAPPPPPLPDDSSLLAKITPGISPQRAASLRLTAVFHELGKALTRLEKTIVIDSSNAYGYFYLAKAQYRLGRYQQSLNFLDVAESRLSGEPFWLAEVHALRGENYRALGQGQKAESSYLQALRLNSGNHTAADALTRLQAETQPVNK